MAAEPRLVIPLTRLHLRTTLFIMFMWSSTLNQMKHNCGPDVFFYFIQNNFISLRVVLPRMSPEHIFTSGYHTFFPTDKWQILVLSPC